ncbi:P-loop containing nucleoside triphosphate hydrolase protein [Xylaria bambusicola]|uniref:P-loop containing nucleoside triphosphate hydrolase protein n=1 Tax=Xylaria bambusicola TaxID=326684 RepID=UPI0020079B19|nr:P-loop containing nucleoside triphosphate hydrolase protein [Xylaria bambusicola]KAI0509261.1 P-loop containing nucleoside triphosphate hydrolase protein [Xylaria bambusicola]
MAAKVEEQPGYGNLSIPARIDKLRELIGTRVALPQLVIVGKQSSGKSSVIESLTGVPRLPTRHVTQISCRRQAEKMVSVSIIVNPEAAAESRASVEDFHRTFTDLSLDSLTKLCREVDDIMSIGGGGNTTDPDDPDDPPLPDFSEHVLKIEKLGPDEDDLTVVDIPDISRQEVLGIIGIEDSPPGLKMVKKYIQDSRTIILAIMPSNIDPAKQAVLKLAQHVDPTMTRTMAILTNPELATQEMTQQLIINYVLGERGDLALGYYIVKTRGPDEVDMTLEQSQAQERMFFANAPWSALAYTGRVGIDRLKQRVQELLIDLFKRNFHQLKSEINKKISILKAIHNKLGPPRNDPHTQRAYLIQTSEAFQSLCRDALNYHYSRHKIFERHDLRLITRVIDTVGCYALEMEIYGHTRAFQSDRRVWQWKNNAKRLIEGPTPAKEETLEETWERLNWIRKGDVYDPSLVGEQAIWFKKDAQDPSPAGKSARKDCTEECEKKIGEANPLPIPERTVHNDGTEEGDKKNGEASALVVLEKPTPNNGTEESDKSKGDEAASFSSEELIDHHRIDYAEAVRKYPELKELQGAGEFLSSSLNQDKVIKVQLRQKYLKGIMEYIQEMYYLSHGQNDNREHITLGHMFITIYHVHHFISEAVKAVFLDSGVRERLWGGYLLEELIKSYRRANDQAMFLLRIEREGPMLTLGNFGALKQNLQELRTDKSMHGLQNIPIQDSMTETIEHAYEVLLNYYNVARERFVDGVYLQAVNYHLLEGETSPLKVFSAEMIANLDDEQLEIIAAEDSVAKQKRAQLVQNIRNFTKALKILEGSE